MSMAIKLRMLCYLRTQGMCVYQPKLRLRPGVRRRGNTARAHYLGLFRLRCYRSPCSFEIPRAWAFQVGILRTFSIKENC